MSGILPPRIEIPKNTQDWDRIFRNLNAMVQYIGGQYRLLGGTQLDSRTSTDLDTLFTKITDDGKASDQTFLPQVSTGGVSSRQDAGPVTATATAVTAQIDIASHTLQYGFGTVSYNSGTITGLTPDTNYYVYADDPNYLGGAVTYLATTNGQNITANNGRYFVGAVRTTVALTTANITAATSTNPVQFTTSAAHGWNTGNTVDFASLPGAFGTAFNTGVFTITRTSATTFTVAIDGSAFAAYTTGGTVTRIETTSISGQGAASGWIDNAFLVQF